MTAERLKQTVPADAPGALDLALEQSHEVKAKVETCADDLATANDAVKEQIAGGTTLLSAHETLLAGSTVEDKVQECADDLHEVTETLARGIDDLAQTEIALTESREILADTQAALAISQEEEKDARRRALRDSMTGLPNRDLFDDRLSNALSVARRLSLRLRDEDTLCRNGGDEFLYLLVDPQGRENIARIAGEVSASIAEPITVGSRQFVVNASIGVAVYPGDGTTGDELIEGADTAMYRAKKNAGDCVFFDGIANESPPARASSLETGQDRRRTATTTLRCRGCPPRAHCAR